MVSIWIRVISGGFGVLSSTTLHCRLYFTLYCTALPCTVYLLYSIHCASHYLLYIVRYTQFAIHCPLKTVYYTLFTKHHTTYTTRLAYSIRYASHYLRYTVRYTQYNIHYSLNTTQQTLHYSLHHLEHTRVYETKQHCTLLHKILH